MDDPARSALTLLSIIVPAYNYGEHVGKCLLSVLSQLPATAELIVVDDGSTDSTEGVLQKLSQDSEANFHCVRQVNQGAAAARNHGLRLCSGSFVLFLDADDELMPNSISAIYSYLGEHPDVDMVIGGHINRRPDGREKISSPSHFQESPCARIADYLIHKRISLCHGSFVVSKELLAKRPYPESLRKREDIPVFAYLLAYANIACIEHVMVRVNKHTTSLRHRDFGEDSENPADLVAEVFKSLPEACQPIRCSYAAIRYQAAFRNALARRCWDEARRLLLESLRHDWKRALSLANMHKAGRALLMGRGQR